MPEFPHTKHAALFSLSDKRGADVLARALHERGVVIYATGGTRTFLHEHGIPALDVEELTGFPALFGGRVKTLHPKVFGAILYERQNVEHVGQRDWYAIPSLDTIVVNLYPFEATVAREGTTLHEAIEQIDIGGVSLLRAAAKNFAHVAVLSHPSQYDTFLGALPDGDIPLGLRRAWAVAAFERTAEYDVAISHYLAAKGELLPTDLPGALTLTLPLAQRLRYGTNPQERAAFYLDRPDRLPEQLHGKELSYNNLLDLDATLRLLSRAPLGADIGSEPERFVRAAVVKHTVPCGVAQRSSVGKAVRDALAADSVSAYGGIVAVDRALDLETAQALREFFLEIVAAPAFDDDALALLKKSKNLRIMRYAPDLPDVLARELRVRSALGGVLAEDDNPEAPAETWRVVSERQPTAQEWHDLAFAWDVVRHVKSNGIVVAQNGTTRGICAGQTNRVSAVKIATIRANAKRDNAGPSTAALRASAQDDNTERIACHGERSAEACHGERSAEACHGERSAEACHGERSAEACHGERSAEACHGERSAEACHGERSAEACHGERSAEGAESNHRDNAGPSTAALRASAQDDSAERSAEASVACASDGYFPFPDGLEAAVEGGCTAIIAPGGSIRDNLVIEAANRLGVALVFSTHRYFLH